MKPSDTERCLIIVHMLHSIKKYLIHQLMFSLFLKQAVHIRFQVQSKYMFSGQI